MAMGLAGMNPVVGGAKPSGNIMINSICPEKDARWGDYSISKTLDSDDNRITIDDNGKLCIKDKEGLKESYINAYYITSEDSDEIFEELIKEAMLPYDERPVHTKSYLYEVFTGNNLITPDQLKYDPLLEEIELDKFSKIISSDIYNIQTQYRDLKTKKTGNYVPDDNYPIMDKDLREEAESILKEYPDYISIYEDMNGFYGYNSITSNRTFSEKSLDKILFETII